VEGHGVRRTGPGRRFAKVGGFCVFVGHGLGPQLVEVWLMRGLREMTTVYTDFTELMLGGARCVVKGLVATVDGDVHLCIVTRGQFQSKNVKKYLGLF
jgi:hypothetical protein